MDRGAWGATVHRVAQNQTQLKQLSTYTNDGRSLAPHERLTDLAVVPREKAHTGAAAREQPQDSPVIAR